MTDEFTGGGVALGGSASEKLDDAVEGDSNADDSDTLLESDAFEGLAVSRELVI